MRREASPRKQGRAAGPYGRVGLGFACDVCFSRSAQELKLGFLVRLPTGQTSSKETPAVSAVLTFYLQSPSRLSLDHVTWQL